MKTIDDKIYNILVEYINKKYLSEFLFCCISGCNNKLIRFIQNNYQILQNRNPKVHILPVYEEKFIFTFNDIVKLRNNKSVKKVIIFTNGTINNIDSLKDFTQVDIKKIEFMDLWDIIKNECDFDWEITNTIEKFLINLNEIIQPDIYKLIEYLEKVNEDSVIFQDLILALNTNLFVFDIWSSSSSTVLRKTKLKSICDNSDPIQIHHKIISPRDIEKIQRKPIDKRLAGRFSELGNQRKILKNMFYERQYQDAYKEINYELIEDSLKGGGKRQGKENEKDEESYAYTNIYSLTLSNLSEFDDITIEIDKIKAYEPELDINIQEEELQKKDSSFNLSIPYCMNGQSFNKEISINLEEAQKKWEQFQTIFSTKNDGSDILEICNAINIHTEDKNLLKNKLELYLNARKSFIEKPSNPIALNLLLDDSMDYVTTFFELIKLLYSFEESTIRNIAQRGILNMLVNIDIEILNGEVYVPYYSPLLIFHLHIMKRRYEECLLNISIMNMHRVQLLEQINNKILNEHIIFDNKTYLLSQDNNEFPYYIKYVQEEYVDSIIKINLNVISSYILNYVKNNPYKNVIKLCLIGDVDLKSLKSVLVKIQNKISNNENGRYLKLKIITKSPNDIREILVSIFEQKERFNKSLQCSIERISEKNKLEDNINSLICENDLTFLLDSSSMYLETRFNKSSIDTKSSLNSRNIDNNVGRIIKHTDIFNEINNFSYIFDGQSASMPIIPNVINAFQNSMESENLQCGERNKYNLNNNLISNINETLSRTRYDNKAVILLSSDNKIDEKIHDNNYLLDIKETMNINDKIKVLSFSKLSKIKEEYRFQTLDQYIQFTANDLLEGYMVDNEFLASVDDNTIDILEYLFFRVYYVNFPTTLEIACNYETQDEEVCNKFEKTSKFLYDTLIKPSITPKMFLDIHDRETFVKLLLRSARTEEDIVFIYSFESFNNIDAISSNYSGFINDEIQSNISSISSISKNTVYRMLKLLGEELISEQAINNFKEILRSNSFDRNDLPYLYDLVIKYNHDFMKFLPENINAMIREV
jgi:hypothetical protein